MQFTSIQPQHYADAIDLTKLAMKELYDVDVDMKFNFQIKNIFVMPGHVTRGMFVDNKMVGFYVLEQSYTIYNDDKSLMMLYFYIKPELRHENNYEQIRKNIDEYALNNNYKSLAFSDQLPFFGEYLKNNTEAKQSTTVYERQI